MKHSTTLAQTKDSGWSGGQWSIVRAALGVYLAIHFCSLLPWATELFSSEGVLSNAASSPLISGASFFPNILAWADHPIQVAGLLASGVLCALALALGWRTRVMALGLWYLWACLLGRNPLILNPGIPYVGWMLLFVAACPRAPYLSLDARGRLDPDGAWRLPQNMIHVAWLVMAWGYTYSGWMKLKSLSWIDGKAIEYVLTSPLARDTWLRDGLVAAPALLTLMSFATLGLELGAGPLSLLPRARKWVWLALVGLHVGILMTVDFADLTIGMLMIHMVTFDPRWVRPRRPACEGTESIVFDGSCGLCHGFVRFVLAEDRAESFMFNAGGQGMNWMEVRFEQNPELVLQGAQAIVYVLGRLGGIWTLSAKLLMCLPKRILDAGYNVVASRRHSIFPSQSDQCPVPPMAVRARFH